MKMKKSILSFALCLGISISAFCGGYEPPEVVVSVSLQGIQTDRPNTVYGFVNLVKESRVITKEIDGEKDNLSRIFFEGIESECDAFVEVYLYARYVNDKPNGKQNPLYYAGKSEVKRLDPKGNNNFTVPLKNFSSYTTSYRLTRKKDGVFYYFNFYDDGHYALIWSDEDDQDPENIWWSFYYLSQGTWYAKDGIFYLRETSYQLPYSCWFLPDVIWREKLVSDREETVFGLQGNNVIYESKSGAVFEFDRERIQPKDSPQPIPDAKPSTPSLGRPKGGPKKKGARY